MEPEQPHSPRSGGGGPDRDGGAEDENRGAEGRKEPKGVAGGADAGAAAGAGNAGRRPSVFELDIGGIIAKSTVMAVVFAVPPIGIFLALHHYTGSVLAGAVVGFGAHFAILAFSPRIAQLLIRGGPGSGRGGGERQ